MVPPGRLRDGVDGAAHDAVIDEIVAAAAPRNRVRALDGAARPRPLRLAALPPRAARGRRRHGPARAARARPAPRVIEPARRSSSARACARCTRMPAASSSRRAGGRVRAGAAVLAINAATRGFRPLRARLSVTSSHIVLTEPVPDVLEAIGWTGGECITDARTFVHYFRTTRDGRIAFGWGGGRLAPGARLGGRVEVDAGVAGRPTGTWSRCSRRSRAARSPTPGAARSTSPEPPAADRHARRRAGALRVRLHRQRRRAVASGRPRARRAGLGRAATLVAVVDRSRRSRPSRSLGGRNAGAPCLFT